MGCRSFSHSQMFVIVWQDGMDGVARAWTGRLYLLGEISVWSLSVVFWEGEKAFVSYNHVRGGRVENHDGYAM